MIRVLLLGRTGNNLFQYAFGRALARKYNVPLVLDGTWFNPASWQTIKPIGQLPLNATIDRAFSMPCRVIKKLCNRHPREWSHLRVLRENSEDQHFRAQYLESGAEIFAMGFFQTELYFQDFAGELRAELDTSNLPWNLDTLKYAEKLEADEHSVAVHVRRTDYIGNSNAEICGLDYYQRAMKRMRQQFDRVRFHVFSDDPAWCGKNLLADDARICNLNGAFNQPLHDLHVMSRAHHHIIANSSYSWWAAWLGKTKGQIVLMPSQWFKGTMHTPIKEKRCSGWECIELSHLK